MKREELHKRRIIAVRASFDDANRWGELIGVELDWPTFRDKQMSRMYGRDTARRSTSLRTIRKEA